MKQFNVQKIVSLSVFLTLLISLVVLIILVIRAPESVVDATNNQPTKSHYTLMIAQCILGVFAMMLPGWLEKSWSIRIPSRMLILYALFLFGAIFLGEVRSYYYNFKYWDAFLHTFSGGMLGAMGFSVITLFNKSEKISIQLSPLFVALFAFCFAITLGVFWEVYEYVFDGLWGLNMQKFGLEDGTPFVGRAALSDTMSDLIVDSLGAFVVASIGYISLKYKKGWIEQLYIRRKKQK